MILTVTNYHENMLRDSPLSLLSSVKFLSSLETKMILKIANETFFKNHPISRTYMYPLYSLGLYPPLGPKPKKGNKFGHAKCQMPPPPLSTPSTAPLHALHHFPLSTEVKNTRFRAFEKTRHGRTNIKTEDGPTDGQTLL